MTDTRRGLLFVMSGPAGAGKTELMKQLKSLEPHIRYCITATTRAPRNGERHEVDYYFYTPEQFAELERGGEFLETAQVPPEIGNFYGTPKTQIEDALREGRDAFVQVDVQGARSIRARIPNAILIFLKPVDLDTLRARLLRRASETPEDRERRLRNAEVELALEPEFDYSVVNEEDQLEQAVAAVREIIATERAAPSRGTP
jgi:guanylate kinase